MEEKLWYNVYTGATVCDAAAAPNEYISVMIADGSGPQYYGRIAQPAAADGTVGLTIPDSLPDGAYTLYVFSEQYNGGANDDTRLTDYASTFEEVALTVSSDSTAPTLTAGAVSRISDRAATVTFTSDEAGSYYYEVVDSGASSPAIDTTVAGVSCAAGEQAISLTGLTAGAKDIYIVVKDAAGNVSQTLKIEVPAYIAPSYGISADTAALDFGSAAEGYAAAPAAQSVTIRNTGNQSVTVSLPTGTNYTITEETGFAGGEATLAPNDEASFAVRPNTGLEEGEYSETLTVSGSDGVRAEINLTFLVNAASTQTVEQNGGTPGTGGSVSGQTRQVATPHSPRTGDSSHVVLWIVLLLASGAGLSAAAMDRRKRRSRT